jgi:FkbM family methyltransferase
MSFSQILGNFLYKHAFVLYKPLYAAFKNKQDAFEISLLKKHIRKGDVVLDVGANIGYYAGILSSLVGETGQVHCFEPDKKNFDYLSAACKDLKNCYLNNKAVGPKTETITIYTSKELNVDHRTYQPEEYDQAIRVDSIRIDDYMQKGGKVDFIKMDIQGFEMHAVKGMLATLQKNSHLKMISEFWPYGLRCAGSSVVEYFDFLTTQGFTCYLLEKHALTPLNREKVSALEPLEKKHYFNIFVTRSHV